MKLHKKVNSHNYAKRIKKIYRFTKMTDNNSKQFYREIPQLQVTVRYCDTHFIYLFFYLRYVS